MKQTTAMLHKIISIIKNQLQLICLFTKKQAYFGSMTSYEMWSIMLAFMCAITILVSLVHYDLILNTPLEY